MSLKRSAETFFSKSPTSWNISGCSEPDLTISKASFITCFDKTDPNPASIPVSETPRLIPLTPGK